MTTGVDVTGKQGKQGKSVSWSGQIKAVKRVILTHQVDTRLYCGSLGSGSKGKVNMDWGSWSAESRVCCVERGTSYLMDLAVLGNDEHEENRCELDTHADTGVGGSNMAVLRYSGKQVTVSGFSDEREKFSNVPIATLATAYDCPNTGRTWILVFNQFLYFGDRMNHSLICPNQLRDFGVKVYDTPKQFDSSSPHAIETDQLKIPLQLKGVISGFITRKPSEEELEDEDNIQIIMTASTEWMPHSRDMELAEEQAEVQDSLDGDDNRICGAYSTLLFGANDDGLTIEGIAQEGTTCALQESLTEVAIAEDNQLASRLISQVQVWDEQNCPGEYQIGALGTISGVSSDRENPKYDLPPEVLARRWGIGLEKARKTLRCTSQAGFKERNKPTDRRYRTDTGSKFSNRYSTLSGKWYSDTMFATTTSIRAFSCAQITTNGDGYTKFFPLKTKADAFLGLADLVINEGIPEVLITDGSKEQASKEWIALTRKHEIKEKKTEPYSPWQNQAELEVREIKRKIRSLTLATKSPKRL